MNLTFDLLEESVSAGLENMAPLTVSGPERDVLVGRNQGWLHAGSACLSGEGNCESPLFLVNNMVVTSKEGAFILDITPELFRKRLSRGRKSLQKFMHKNCGLVNNANACRCHKQAGGRLKNGLIDMTLVKKENCFKRQI